ncbi:MAG TPA: hypothetical protein VI894_00435 [Candidatus Nanoarchaeia archaeon]|nr:hypothetical protein [Candidatus Nanoarchaeia archaeon]
MVSTTIQLIVLFVGLLISVLLNVYFIFSSLAFSKKYFAEIQLYFKAFFWIAVFIGIMELFYFFTRLFFVVNQTVFPVMAGYFDVVAIIILVVISFLEYKLMSTIKRMDTILLKVK